MSSLVDFNVYNMHDVVNILSLSLFSLLVAGLTLPPALFIYLIAQRLPYVPIYVTC